jgi:hypothetical protein
MMIGSEKTEEYRHRTRRRSIAFKTVSEGLFQDPGTSRCGGEIKNFRSPAARKRNVMGSLGLPKKIRLDNEQRISRTQGTTLLQSDGCHPEFKTQQPFAVWKS